MKPLITKTLLIAGIALISVPSALFAQKEKEKDDKTDKDKTFQQIIITRTGNKDEKTVVEIKGDKVLVNGKDVKDKDNDDVTVHVNTVKGARVYRYNDNPGRTFSYNFNDDNMSLFSENSNRAMLGVNTEGTDKGAQIELVTEGSAADKAGLKKGDVITKIDNKAIESSDDLTEAVRAHKPGDKVGITYLRDGKEQKITTELGKWKGINMNTLVAPKMDMGQFKMTMPEGPVYNGAWAVGGRPKLGMSIQDTDDGVGVKVLDVDDEGAAAKAGIKEDDIIVGIDDQVVKGTDDVTNTIRDNKDKTSYTFKVKRNGKTENVEVKVPRKLKKADL
ncbi:MAG: PDZ domain-containing protein [Flavisolibacter sp.]